jgi:hypothetical protein
VALLNSEQMAVQRRRTLVSIAVGGPLVVLELCVGYLISSNNSLAIFRAGFPRLSFK